MHTVFDSFDRISPRTLVTQDDPLGALKDSNEHGAIQEGRSCTPESKGASQQSNTHQANSNNNTIYSDQPILFKGQRSATFDDSVQLNKSIQRSETMPATNAVASSFVSLGSTLKFNFG